MFPQWGKRVRHSTAIQSRTVTSSCRSSGVAAEVSDSDAVWARRAPDTKQVVDHTRHPITGGCGVGWPNRVVSGS